LKILYEKRHAEKILKSGFSSFMSRGDLFILAKYFKHIGKNKRQIEKDLILFCEEHNPEFNHVIFDKIIKNIVRNSLKYALNSENPVKITKNELKSIRSVKNYNKEKILLVMLVSAKYLAKKGAESFYAKMEFTEIIKRAKVSVPKEERKKILHALNNTELIQATFFSNSFRVTFVDMDNRNNGDGEAFIVDDVDNVPLFLPFFCDSCGKQLKKKPKRRVVCNKCYPASKNEQTAARVKKHREKR